VISSCLLLLPFIPAPELQRPYAVVIIERLAARFA